MTVRILHGDCRALLRGMADASVHCVVTSPPYFGLRDYGHAEQIGLEESPQAFVDELVAIFREVRRVLRSDGTLWLNLGDSYVGSANNGGVESKTMRGSQAATGRNLPPKRGPGIKAKDLIGIPWRVAFALQADGWWLRQDIIWSKPNPMPESVRDRCTKAHEYLFLLAKSERYYFDEAAIAEPAEGRSDEPRASKVHNADSSIQLSGRGGFGGETRNKRSVWTVATQPYSEAHFATFPPALIEPCIKAGCPEGGTVLDPFGGAGTTGLVADGLQRNAVLIEINADYVRLASDRIIGDAPLFADVELAR